MFDEWKRRKESRLIQAEHASLVEILAELEGAAAVLAEVKDTIRTTISTEE